MVRKFRYRENRSDPNGRKPEPRFHYVFEPLDWALLAVIGAIVLWLQWLMGALAG